MRNDQLSNVPWVFTSFPSDTFKMAVGSALLDYVQGDKKWDDVKKTVKDKWKSEQS